MSILNKIWNWIYDNPEAFFAGVSLIISLVTFVYTRSFNKNFARQEFIKKQIEVVTGLTDYLNSAIIKLAVTKFDGNGSSSTDMDVTIFELDYIPKDGRYESLRTLPVVFNGYCNQLIDVKKFIYNPFLPKSIANALEDLYAHSNESIKKSTLSGSEAIVVTTSIFEGSLFERPLEFPAQYVKECRGFAFLSWENLIATSVNLEAKIVSFLSKYKVREINVRRNHLTT